MQHNQEGAAAQSSAVEAPAPVGGEPGSGLGWLVDYGYCPSLAEAESFRERALESEEGDSALSQAEPRAGSARWRRWLEIGRPGADEETVRDAVLSWRIEALGDRPRDHLVRDLLHASLLRDLRTEVFHRKTIEPEPWVEDRVAHLDHRHRLAAIQHTVLDAMNRRLVGLLWRELEGRLGPPDPDRLGHGDDYGLLLSLWACPPVGALLEWQGEPDHIRDFGDGGCRHGRVCPWCHARRVLALYDRLASGPCRPDRLKGKSLIRIRVRFPGSQLQHRPAFAAFARKRGYDVRHSGTQLGSRRFLSPDEVRLVRQFWGDWLSSSRSPWGIEGGIIAHQVESHLDRQNPSEELEHLHELTLVGSLPSSRLGLVAGIAEEMGIGFANNRISTVHVDVFRGDDPQSLRLILAGPPYKFYKHRGPVHRNQLDTRVPCDDNGALRPVHLFQAGSPQWWSYYEATRGSKLYSTFGTWREALGRKAVIPRLGQAPLKRHNEEIRDEAEGRRKQLLIAALPIFADLTARTARKPGHSVLRAALARHLGRDVSDRDARWLASKLKKG